MHDYEIIRMQIGNIIALTPPLCFTLDNARRVIEAFDKALTKVNQMEEDPQDAPSTSILGYSCT